MRPFRYGTVCSGIGAPEQAWKDLGWQCEFASEIEKFPSAVHQLRFPGVPNLGDMTQFKEWNDYAIDLLVGGTPCQSFSVAGLRKGLDDPRGNLMLTFGAIAARYKPRWILWENVPGVLSSEGGSDFGTFLGMLVQLGYGFAYRVFDAQYFGLAQRRKRVFVVGHSGGQWQRAAAVLFDSKSLCGDNPPRREAREGATGTLSARTKGGGGLGTDFDLGGGLTTTGIPEVARSIAAERDGYNDGSDQTYIPEIAWALQERDSKGVDSDTKEGHLIPVAFSCKDSGADAGELAPTLRTGQHDGSHANGGVMPAVAFEPRYFTRDNKTGGAPGDISVLKADASKAGDSSPHVAAGMMVRRLTPRECERLQGFPDDFTMIPWSGRAAEDCPDGPRYRALGNSMAVPVMRWLGERIKLLETILPFDKPSDSP